MYRLAAKAHKLLTAGMYPQLLELQSTDRKTLNMYVPDLVHHNTDGCKFVLLPSRLRAGNTGTAITYTRRMDVSPVRD